MDIHPPEGPTHSFRDFLIHIGVVTIGILIALGLETLEEHVHDRYVVREARENFHVELEGDRANLDKELTNDRQTLALCNRIIADLPQLRKQPGALAAQIAQIKPSGYFLPSARWEAALSTGALGHMPVGDVNSYAVAHFLTQTYTGLQAKSSPDWVQLEAFFSAHPDASGSELDAGIEKLFIYQGDARGLDQVAKELSGSIDDALAIKVR